MDCGIAIARKYGNRFRIVTLDGQVLNRGGSMTGGSAAKSAGVLTRANTLAKLAEERKALTESAETLKAQTAEAASAAAKTEFELTAVRGQLREAEDEVLRRTEEAIQAALDEVRESRVRFRSASAEQMQVCQEKLKSDPTKQASED